MTEKEKLEIAACSTFLVTYNRDSKSDFKIDDDRDKKDKPDLLIKDSKTEEVIGVEVSHLYYDKKEAKMLLGRSTEKNHGLMNSDSAIKELNSLLNKKVKQAENYNYDKKLFLVIRVTLIIFNKDTFDMFNDKITIPENNFDQIWLNFYDRSIQDWGVLKKLQ